MKKLFLLFFVAISLTSCKKYYTCECTTTWTGYFAGDVDTYTGTSPKMKKKDAEKWCSNQENEFSDGSGNGYTTSCKLK